MISNAGWGRKRPRPTRFAALLDHLRAQDAEAVTLTLEEICALVGWLPVSAYVNSGYWHSASSTLSRQLAALGWRARLSAQAQTLTFTRLPGEG